MSNKVIIIGSTATTAKKNASEGAKNAIKDRGFKFQYIADYSTHPQKDKLETLIKKAKGMWPVLAVGSDVFVPDPKGVELGTVIKWLESKNVEKSGALSLKGGQIEYDEFRYIQWLVNGAIREPGSATDFTDWPRDETREERLKNTSFTINGKTYVGDEAFKRLESGMFRGLLSLRQIKTLKISHENGAGQGQKQTINVGKDWLNLLNKAGSQGLSTPTLNFTLSDTPGIGSDEKQKEKEKLPSGVESEIQEIINDVATILKGEGMDSALSQTLGVCALDPSLKGERGMAVFSAAGDYVLGAAAASFAAGASTAGMLKALDTAQGKKSTAANLISKLKAGGRLGKGIGAAAEVFMSPAVRTASNLVGKRALFNAVGGAAAYSAVKYGTGASEEKAGAVGTYVWLHLFANGFPGVKFTGKLKMLAAVTAAVTQVFKLMAEPEEDFSCAVQRTLFGLAFGSGHVAFIPATRFLADKDFRSALTRATSDGDWDNATRKAIEKLLKETYDDVEEEAIKKIFANIDTGPITWDAEKTAFLKDVVSEAKARGINMRNPNQTFNLSDDLKSRLAKMKFEINPNAAFPGGEKSGQEVFLEFYVNPLNKRVTSRVQKLREKLDEGLKEVTEELQKQFDEAREIAEAVNGKKMEWSQVQAKIDPILEKAVKTANKTNIKAFARLHQSVIKNVDDSLAEASRILEQGGILKKPKADAGYPAELHDEIVAEYRKFLEKPGDALDLENAAERFQTYVNFRNPDLGPAREEILNKIRPLVRNSKLKEKYKNIVNSSAAIHDSLLNMDLANAAIADNITRGFRVMDHKGVVVNAPAELFEQSTKVLEEEILKNIAQSTKRIKPVDTIKKTGQKISSSPLGQTKAAQAGSQTAQEAAENIFRFLTTGSVLGRRLSATGLMGGAGAAAAGGAIGAIRSADWWNKGTDVQKQLKRVGAKVYGSILLDKIAKNALKFKLSEEREGKFTDNFLNFDDLTKVTSDEMVQKFKEIMQEPGPDQKAFTDQDVLDNQLRPAVIGIINKEGDLFKETKNLLSTGTKEADIKMSLGDEAEFHSGELLGSNAVFDEYLEDWIKTGASSAASNEVDFSTSESASGDQHAAIAERELNNWPKDEKGRPLKENDPSTWPIIAGYWKHIKRNDLAKKTLNKKRPLYKSLEPDGKEGPAWSSAFITFCMQGDVGFKNLLGGRGGGAHYQYYKTAIQNSLNIVKKINNKEFDVGVDWIFLPVTKNPGNDKHPALAKGHEQIMDILQGQPNRYSQKRGDIGLKSSGTVSGLHGDIFINSKDKVGGNLGDAVKKGKGVTRAILTKNPDAVKQLYEYASNISEGKVQMSQQNKINKGVTIMNKKDLENLVKEVLTENSGQGYAPYPYGSSVRDEEEPKEDYVEEWKNFCLQAIDDLDARIAIAKLLVKDRELFEDVLDLAGQNQSIGQEILRKMEENRQNQENM